MRKLLLGLAMLLLGLSLMPRVSEAATAKATRAADTSAQQAIVQCRAMYVGDLGRNGNMNRPTGIEGCFKQKTGRYPFELGIPIYPHGYDPFTGAIR